LANRLDSRRKRYIVSLLMTLLIVLVLLYPTTTATAISVSIKGLQGATVPQGDTQDFNIDLTIETGERVPISTVRVTIDLPNGTSFTYDFPLTGGTKAIITLNTPQSFNDTYGYGYGYWYDQGPLYGYGYGYFPPTGYGYGYYQDGTGYGFYGLQTLRWDASLRAWDNAGNLPDGEYKIRVQVQSNGAWWGGPPTETTFTITAAAPVITIISPKGTYTVDSVPTSLPLEYTVDRPTDWVGYSLDSAPNVTLVGNTTLTDLSEGSHSLTVYANDTAGNMGSSTASFTVSLPGPPPPPPPPPPPAAKPDLEPTLIEVTPSVPIEGEESTVEVTVNNTGTEDANAFNVTLKADEALVQTMSVVSLAEDDSISLSFTWTPADAATYELTATVDPEDAVDESDEANNDISLTVTVREVPPPPLPDLTVEFIDLPEEFEAEKTYEIKAVVRNIDGADAPRFSVRLEADDTGVQTLSVDSLAVEESITLTFRWTPPEPDTYELTVIVDPGDLIEELDETNNTDSATVTVEEVPVPVLLPDLTVEFVDLPEEFEAGRTYAIRAQVRNIGEGDAETFNVALKANGASVQQIEVESLAAGASTTLAFTWTPGEFFPGDYTLAVTADSGNDVTEADETNNIATTEVTVSPKPREVIWYEQWGPVIAGAVTIIIIVIIAIVITRQRR